MSEVIDGEFKSTSLNGDSGNITESKGELKQALEGENEEFISPNIKKSIAKNKRYNYKDIKSPDDRVYIFSKFLSYPTEPAIVSYPYSKNISSTIDTYLIKIANDLKDQSNEKKRFLEGLLNFILKEEGVIPENMYEILVFMNDYDRSTEGESICKKITTIVTSKKLANMKKGSKDEFDMQGLLLRTIVKNFPSHKGLERIIIEGIQESIYPYYYYILTVYYYLNGKTEEIKTMIKDINEDNKRAYSHILYALSDKIDKDDGETLNQFGENIQKRQLPIRSKLLEHRKR